MAKDNLNDIQHERKEARPDFSQPPPARKLPKDLQDTLDNEENLWETVYEGSAGESTESNLRYAAYASRIRTILMSTHRYVAYTSDIGESFRPVAHPNLVRGAYGISWAYLIGDVSYEGYKAYLRNQRVLYPELHEPAAEKEALSHSTSSNATDIAIKPGKLTLIEDYRAVMFQRAVFQSIASMGLPAFTIHSIVKYSGRAFKNSKNKIIRTWTPIGLGLAAVPFLPFIFDEPVEEAVEWTFHKGFQMFGGPNAVRGRPAIGNAELRVAESKAGAKKEKEL